MDQLAINFTARSPDLTPRYPSAKQTQLWTLLAALEHGERLSTVAALKYGCGACSQRMGDLKRLGWPIKSVNVKNENGGFHAEYFL